MSKKIELLVINCSVTLFGVAKWAVDLLGGEATHLTKLYFFQQQQQQQQQTAVVSSVVGVDFCAREGSSSLKKSGFITCGRATKAIGAVLGFHCESTNGHEHSLFFSYESSFINILPSVCILPLVCSLRFTLIDYAKLRDLSLHKHFTKVTSLPSFYFCDSVILKACCPVIC